jgi:hypothetical protein
LYAISFGFALRICIWVSGGTRLGILGASCPRGSKKSPKPVPKSLD